MQDSGMPVIAEEELHAAVSSGSLPVLLDIQSDDIIWNDGTDRPLIDAGGEPVSQYGGEPLRDARVRDENGNILTDANGHYVDASGNRIADYLLPDFDANGFVKRDDEGSPLSLAGTPLTNTVNGTEWQEDGHLRLVGDTVAVIYQGRRYVPCALAYTAGTDDGKTKGDASIRMSALDTRVVQAIRSLDGPARVRIVAAFVRDGDVFEFYEMTGADYSLSQASWDGVTAQFPLVFDETMDLSVPRDLADMFKFPASPENKQS